MVNISKCSFEAVRFIMIHTYEAWDTSWWAFVMYNTCWKDLECAVQTRLDWIEEPLFDILKRPVRCTLSVPLYSDGDYTRTVNSPVGLRDHGSQQPPSTDHKLSPEVLTLSIKYDMSAVNSFIGTWDTQRTRPVKVRNVWRKITHRQNIERVLLSQREYLAS